MAVPVWTTLRSTCVVVSAEARLTTCLAAASGSLTRSEPSLVIFSTSVYVPCLPWLASVAYASVMSSTLAVAVPSAMDGYGWRSGVPEGRPRATAVFLTVDGPTSTAICAYTEFTDLSVAWRTEILPYETLSSFSGAYAPPLQPCTDRLFVPSYTVLGVMAAPLWVCESFSTAEVNTNGLKVEPTW